MMLRPGGGIEQEYWRVRGKYRCPGSPAVPALRQVGLKRCFDLRAERNGYQHPNLRMVIVNSNMVKAHCLQHYPHLRDRVEVIHNGSEPPSTSSRSRENFLQAVGLQTERTTALFLGHDFARKGLSETILGVAAAVQQDPDLPLQVLVAGRGHFHPYRSLACRLGVADRIRYVGTAYCTQELLQAADLLVLPSFFDSFANVTVEALTAGLPVLTTLSNGAHEILTHGKDSWLISDPTHIELIAAHFLELRTPGVLTAMQQEAKRTGCRYQLQDQLHLIEQKMCEVASQAKPGVQV